MSKLKKLRHKRKRKFEPSAFLVDGNLWVTTAWCHRQNHNSHTKTIGSIKDVRFIDNPAAPSNML